MNKNIMYNFKSLYDLIEHGVIIQHGVALPQGFAWWQEFFPLRGNTW